MSRGALKVFSEAIASSFLQSSLKDPRLIAPGLGKWGGGNRLRLLARWLSHEPTVAKTHAMSITLVEHTEESACVLPCLNASSSAVLIKPCWLLSMVDFLADT